MQNHATSPRVLTADARVEAALDLQGFCKESVTVLASEHRGIREHVGKASEGYWRAGKRLEALKQKLAGKYDEFIKGNQQALGFGYTTAYIYRRFYLQHAEGAPDSSLREMIVADRSRREATAGDVQLKPGCSGFAGVVNRFELVWQRAEQAGAIDTDEARELFRPVYDRLKGLFEG